MRICAGYRLARSIGDHLQHVARDPRPWRYLEGDRAAIDTSIAAGKCFLDMLGICRWARQLIMVRGRGDDAAPRLALVKRERNEHTGKILARSRRFYNLGVSGLKMSPYRDLQKDDPNERGYVSFPSGLGDDYFQELTSERRTAVKNRDGFTVHRWTKDDRQDNEALDTAIIATGAAIRFGVYSLSDRGWDTLRSQREIQPSPVPAPMLDKQPTAPDVISESTARPTMTPEEYYRQQAERARENEEKVAAEHRASWLNPHGRKE